MYVNDLEDELCTKGFKGIDITLMKMFLLMYADDIIIMAEMPEDLQLGLNIIEQYCNKWKLKLDKNKTKIIVFRKGGLLRRNLKFYYDNNEIEVGSSFTYLGIVLPVEVHLILHNKHWQDKPKQLYIS